ncbi:MAG: Lrp/AsnC family transcriptional regulator [Flammeovirgaceae bacterium]
MIENQLDTLDKSILQQLFEDGRKSYAQIAKDLDISNSLVHQRMSRLKAMGIVQGTKLKINPVALGYQSCAYTGIKMSDGKMVKLVAKKLAEVNEIVECSYVSGQYAFLIKTYARNNDHMRQILFEKVLTIEGVAGTDTFIAFKQVFDRDVPIEGV